MNTRFGFDSPGGGAVLIWSLRGPLVTGSPWCVTFPILCSFGDLGTASGCDIGDRKNLEEKPARIMSA
jgi:hypothetical protein